MAPPVRTCIGCGQKRLQSELLRVALHEEAPRLDRRRRAGGRGAYLCGTGCLKAAWKRKAFSRAFKGRMRLLELNELERALADGNAVS